MPRRNYTKGERKREAIERRIAERELRELEKEIHTEQHARREQADIESSAEQTNNE